MVRSDNEGPKSSKWMCIAESNDEDEGEVVTLSASKDVN